MKSLTWFCLVIVFSNVLIFVRSISVTSCLRGKDAKRFNDRLVQEHNFFRKRHGVPPLEAESSLMEDSIRWSEQMTNSGKMHHSKAQGYGENLYRSAHPDPVDESDIDAVQRWYDEIKLYDNANPRFSKRTGHFTQVVWQASRKVGCGVCAGTAGTFVTCRYTPPGNFNNLFKENVPPVKESESETTTENSAGLVTSSNDDFTENTESYTADSDGHTIDPDTRSTIKPNEPSDTYSKLLKIALSIIGFIMILVSVVPVALLSTMIYKSATSSHRPI